MANVGQCRTAGCGRQHLHSEAQAEAAALCFRRRGLHPRRINARCYLAGLGNQLKDSRYSTHEAKPDSVQTCHREHLGRSAGWLEAPLRHERGQHHRIQHHPTLTTKLKSKQRVLQPHFKLAGASSNGRRMFLITFALLTHIPITFFHLYLLFYSLLASFDVLFVCMCDHAFFYYNNSASSKPFRGWILVGFPGGNR
jgi:hypothetical protein